MNLRIESQRMAFKIKKKELEKIISFGKVTQQTNLPNGSALQISITLFPEQSSPLVLNCQENLIELHVNSTAINQLKNNPSKKGVECIYSFNQNKEHLDLALMVDLRDKGRTPLD